MTEVPHVFLFVSLEIDGKSSHGIAADHLPPKWFTKQPKRDTREEIVEMVQVITHAMSLAEGRTGATVFHLWRQLYEEQVRWADERGIPPLLAHFGTSLVERACIDAFARKRARPLHELCQSNELGIDLAYIHPQLRDSTPRDWLPTHPLRHTFARHTVGLVDRLTAADAVFDDPPSDGLPTTLEECIAHYGLHHFKIKIGADADSAVARFEKIGEVLTRCARADFRCSLDGNENFHTPAEFAHLLATLTARPGCRELLRHVSFIEQPLHRDVALSADLPANVIAMGIPIVIDESDGAIGDFARAFERGYTGTTHKNCKGVFKGIANACRIVQLRRETGRQLIMSGEDLANVGPVALLQDLAVQSLLGIESVERNGHHYFAGLSFWPRDIQERILTLHPDLYELRAEGWPSLRIVRGEIALDSVNAAPFGVRFLPNLNALLQQEAMYEIPEE